MCISCFILFTNELILAVYFIYTLDYWNDVRQKSKFKWSSYSSSKWIIKQWRHLATPTTHLAQELPMNIQCSGGSRSSAKIEPCRGGAPWLAFRSWPRPIQRITETYPLTITWEVDQELDVDHSVRSSAFEANWKGEKLDKWADGKSRKSSLWSVIVSYFMHSDD